MFFCFRAYFVDVGSDNVNNESKSTLKLLGNYHIVFLLFKCKNIVDSLCKCVFLMDKFLLQPKRYDFGVFKKIQLLSFFSLFSKSKFFFVCLYKKIKMMLSWKKLKYIYTQLIFSFKNVFCYNIKFHFILLYFTDVTAKIF